ncbi:MAG: FCD domain-containing protein [Granulosicoccus sp.]|nr:FCD domain-containing protein [Granulosicoccus sp.]
MPETTTVPPEPHGDERASDRIIRHIEQQILSGTLPDRSPLPAERDLMEQFGSSRAVVREAISALGHRGLVEQRPRFRPVVRKPGVEAAFAAVGNIVEHLLGDENGVRNLYESRLFFEKALVRQAALHACKQDIDDLRTALAHNEAAIDDSEAFYQSDMAFHGVLYRIPRNPIFPAVHSAYTSWLAPHWSRMPRSPERNAMNFRSHAEILERIIERDADGAEIALRRHLDTAWEYVRVTFPSSSTPGRDTRS